MNLFIQEVANAAAETPRLFFSPLIAAVRAFASESRRISQGASHPAPIPDSHHRPA